MFAARPLSIGLLFGLALSLLAPLKGVAEDKPAEKKDEKKEQPLNVPPAGFVALFNGKDLSGWVGRGHMDPMTIWKMSPEDRAKEVAAGLEDVKKHWTIDNGELVNDGNGLYLTTGRDYGDFELLLDYKTVPLADSGIYLRGTPQVQIWDTRKEGGKWNLGADKGSGSLWNNQKHERFALALADKPFGEWNHFRIVMVGEYVSVWLNDILVVNDTPLENFFQRDKPVYPVGPIQLQTHGGEIRFKNVFLREIPRRPPESGFLVQGKPAGDDWVEPSQATFNDFELHALLPGDLSSSEASLKFRDGKNGDAARAYTFGIGKGRWGTITDAGGDGTVSTASEGAIQRAVKPDASNHLYLRAKGPHLQAWLNGTQVADLMNPRGPAAGTISLDTGKAQGTQAQQIWVRDLAKIPDPSTFPAGPKDEEGFVSVFNGKDLTGWVGAVDGHKVDGGKLVAPAKGGGNLYIDKKYSNFVYRFEFRIHEGGNNGVGIRAEQGKDAAYYGMEIQILDNTSPSYAGIKPYQAHGSVYGVFPAKRGYQAPLGEWNTEEIIADGSHITVTLNGKVITDCDIEKEGRDAEGKQKTIDGGNHPGLFNKDGYIGFLGHGHPLEFRNLRIKELK